MPTIEELDKTVHTIKELTDWLRQQVFPNGKPSWMTEEKWSEIRKNKDEDIE